VYHEKLRISSFCNICKDIDIGSSRFVAQLQVFFKEFFILSNINFCSNRTRVIFNSILINIHHLPPSLSSPMLTVKREVLLLLILVLFPEGFSFWHKEIKF
jgi:hypothetical protein